jgi:formyltetrahydrofolate hydrolase
MIPTTELITTTPACLPKITSKSCRLIGDPAWMPRASTILEKIDVHIPERNIFSTNFETFIDEHLEEDKQIVVLTLYTNSNRVLADLMYFHGTQALGNDFERLIKNFEKVKQEKKYFEIPMYFRKMSIRAFAQESPCCNQYTIIWDFPILFQ